MEVIRKLELSDLNQMLTMRIGIQDYDLPFLNINETKLNREELIEKTKSYIESHLNKNLHMYGYFIDEELVANCGFYVDEHFPTYDNPNGLLGYICNVFTKEEYRGKGYQKKLFGECINSGKEMGITKFKLSSINDKAINMYKAFGFKQVDNMYCYKV